MGRYLTSTDFIIFEVRDAVARITLNRPERRNALSRELLMELHAALTEADALTDVNVILLDGAGKDFCAGYDLAASYAGRAAEGNPAPGRNEPSYRSLIGTVDDDCWNLEYSQRFTLAMFDLHKPVIAKVHGNCLAGGTDIALGCDIVIAAEDARIGFPATRANGNPPNHWWYYHVGPQWAKRMLFTGDVILGKDAAKIGLVLDWAPTDRLEEEAYALARRIALVDAELLSTYKRVVNFAMEMQGAKTLQRFSAELDARAHFTNGPRRTQFKADMATGTLKQALTNRDGPFGDSVIRANWFKD
ncbi:MAG: crotonase/enoyl-CoA hydratase family protein [Caulobacteraceae bacterium]|nr:crotonase/enoyl-CoA hydratase family protein [Caulobacteraceae bacterium]